MFPVEELLSKVFRVGDLVLGAKLLNLSKLLLLSLLWSLGCLFLQFLEQVLEDLFFLLVNEVLFITSCLVLH